MLERTDATGTMRFWQQMGADGGAQFSWRAPYESPGLWFSVHWCSQAGVARPPGPEASAHFAMFGVGLHRRRAHIELRRGPGDAIAGARTRRWERLYVAIPLYRLRPFAEGVDSLVVRVVDDASGEVLAERPFDPALLDIPARAFEEARGEWEAMIADPARHCPPDSIVVT